jgi:hypothetical protein
MDELPGKGWIATAVAAALLCLAPAPGAPAPARRPGKRPGKVVRVERPRLIAQAAIRICPVPFPDRSKGTCYGGAPEIGDSATLFDFEGNYLGALRVLAVEPSDTDSCQSGSIFDFTYELAAPAAPAPPSRIPYALGVFGMKIDPARSRLVTGDRSRLPVPEGAGKAQPWMGLDQDGDDSVDMVVTAFECKDVTPPPGAGSKAAETYCLDYWQGKKGSFTQTRRDLLYTCL